MENIPAIRRRHPVISGLSLMVAHVGANVRNGWIADFEVSMMGWWRDQFYLRPAQRWHWA